MHQFGRAKCRLQNAPITNVQHYSGMTIEVIIYVAKLTTVVVLKGPFHGENAKFYQ